MKKPPEDIYSRAASYLEGDARYGRLLIAMIGDIGEAEAEALLNEAEKKGKKIEAIDGGLEVIDGTKYVIS